MNWDDIKFVLSVARWGGVRSAAQHLKVHHSTVSRRIEALESTLNVRLFDRLPEGLVLTAAGERLTAVAKDFDARLSDAARELSGLDTELSGVLTVTMGEPVARLCIGPRLDEFCAVYPQLELRFLITYDTLDVSRREADVAIRMDNNPPDTLVGKRLFAYFQSLYAAPEYLAQHDLAKEPETARWIGWGADDGPHPSWTAQTPFPNTPAWGSFTDLSVQVAAAKAGLGLAMLPCMVADPEPGLTRLPNAPTYPARDIWLLTHNDLRKTARVKAFMDFAENCLRAQKAEIMGQLAL